MSEKPTYEKLEQRIQELEAEVLSIKESEKALKKSHRNFQALLNNSSDYILISDDEGFPVTFNVSYAQEIYRALGIEMKPGLKPHTLLQDKKMVDYWNQLHQRALNGEKFTVEYTHKFNGEGIKHFEICFTPIIEDGTARGFTEITRDITKRKQAEEALRESEELYRTIFNTVPVSIILIDKDGQMVEINPYHVTQLGKGQTSKEDYVGVNLITHPSIVNAGLSETYRKVLEGEPFDQKDVYFPTTTGGTDGYFSVKGAPLFKDGKVIGAVTTHEDVAERKRIERALQEALDELEQRVEERTRELELKTKSLEELNTAMKVLLKKRGEDKTELEENVMTNVKELIAPYFDKISETKLDDHQKAFLNILESNLNEIVSPFTRKLSLKYLRLTPKEIQIVNMIKIGYPSKKIAKIMKISPRTVDTHRKNIRSKIGLGKKKANLRSHLLAHEQ